MLLASEDTLSRHEFARAAVGIEAFISALNDEFGDAAAPLIAVLADGAHDVLQDRADDLMMDILVNQAEVLASFTALGGHEEEFPIEIKGIRPLCFVWAPEFGRTGPFPSIALAESYVRSNWMDSLVSDAAESGSELSHGEFVVTFPQGRRPTANRSARRTRP